MPSAGAVRVADGVWWVGTRLENDQFQCHAYLIENGDESVLLDPGSALTIDEILAKVDEVVGIDAVKYLVAHHPDPDIAGSLPVLSERLARPDVEVVTEWRAQALLKHYGHRFAYYRVEDHDWLLPLRNGRELQFQLTPYLHFPGAMVSFDTHSHTLFSSDLFGGFVPDSEVLVSDDLDYVIEAARPFHQHYMPSTELLNAGLARIQRKWPDIELIAPQHGHLIPAGIVDAAFAALKDIDCGVFMLSDADVDLKRLLRLSEAKAQITQTLASVSDPSTLVSRLSMILGGLQPHLECALLIDVPRQGWTMWGEGRAKPVLREPDPLACVVDLPGPRAAQLVLRASNGQPPNDDIIRLLVDLAPTIRLDIDEYLRALRQSQRTAAFREASLTDPLTELANRRALDSDIPTGAYALICLDLDLFKEVNDTFGHSAGDVVLKRVAEAFRDGVRDIDTAYRIGGEEFLVCLPGAGEADAVAIAHRIRLAVRELDFDGYAPGGRITVSAGVSAVQDASPEEFAQAFEVADQRLYASKRAGRDRVTP